MTALADFIASTHPQPGNLVLVLGSVVGESFEVILRGSTDDILHETRALKAQAREEGRVIIAAAPTLHPSATMDANIVVEVRDGMAQVFKHRDAAPTSFGEARVG